MRRTLIVVATLAAIASPASTFAQTAYGGSDNAAPKSPPGAGQTETGNDPSAADNLGTTGWSGSWTANEGSQNDDAGTPTTDQAKPMPPKPPVEGEPR